MHHIIPGQSGGEGMKYQDNIPFDCFGLDVILILSITLPVPGTRTGTGTGYPGMDARTRTNI